MGSRHFLRESAARLVRNRFDAADTVMQNFHFDVHDGAFTEAFPNAECLSVKVLQGKNPA
jgi:hypothetical protein